MKKPFFMVFVLFFILSFILGAVIADTDQAENNMDSNIETIRVSNETEFINAIGSNRIIELNPGTYSLSKFHELETKHVFWNNIGNGYQLGIYNVENISIIGLGDEPVKIHIEPTDAYVFTFKNSNQITIKNIEAGHFPEKGYCQGGVLYFENSKDILIENAILFGCGAEGLTLYQVDNLLFTRSIIKDCSYGIMTVEESTNLNFSESSFFNNLQYNLLNFTKCTNISFTKCEMFHNKAISSYGFFNTYESKGIVIKESKVHHNTAAHFLSSDEKETVKIYNTIFKNNHFYEGGYYNSTIDKIFKGQRSGDHRQWEVFYKRLEYISRKVNDPDKLDKSKGGKIFEKYWQKAVSDLSVFGKQQGVNWETESLLGKFYQVGIRMDIKDAWKKAETHLRNAIKLNPKLPCDNHLALGALYASKHFSFMMSERDHQSKLVIDFKPQQPSYLAAAERELIKDNKFPGTSNMYLFLIYYFQGKFETAYEQANRYLEVFQDDELMRKFRSMAKKRIGNKQVPGELNIYITREKTRRLFDFYFIQGSTSSQSINFDDVDYEKDQYRLNLKEFADNGLEFKLGNTRKAMIKSIGNPTKVETQKVENRHEKGVTDTIYELFFDGFYVGIYDNQGKEIILYYKITNRKYKVKYGLNIGVSKDKVNEIFGKPQEEKENFLRYIYEDEVGYQTIVDFGLNAEKVTAISWSFPID